MGNRTPTDPTVTAKRVKNDVKVLRHLLANLKSVTPGPLESPQKLVTFYAGYTAMRSLWEVKTNSGKLSTGDSVVDAEMRNAPGKLIFRVNMEVSHSLGEHTKTLLRVATFRHWAKKALALWGN